MELHIPLRVARELKAFALFTPLYTAATDVNAIEVATESQRILADLALMKGTGSALGMMGLCSEQLLSLSVPGWAPYNGYSAEDRRRQKALLSQSLAFQPREEDALPIMGPDPDYPDPGDGPVFVIPAKVDGSLGIPDHFNVIY